jgi:hypothetical protein
MRYTDAAFKRHINTQFNTLLALDKIMKISNFKEDVFELESFATRLEEFISVEHEYVEGSLVIALSSSFGTGKSTFLDMWTYSLENRQKESGTPLIIRLNAWESDYFGDPLFAIISALIDKVKAEGKSADRLINAAKDFGWFATAIGNQIVAKVTGVDAIAAGELAETKKDARKESEALSPDSFSIFQDRKDAMLALKDAIQSFVEEYGSQVLFLVDELDRCRPDYAISYLETIKHLFDVKGAVFILAADRHQLECSAKRAFGADLKFNEYYRKFIHREICLPKMSHDNYRSLALKYVPYYLEKEEIRNCYMKMDSVSNIIDLIAALELTPRQIQEVFRILGHIFETSEENKGRLRWCLAVGSIMMASLKVGHPNMFNQFGLQAVKPEDGYSFLKNLLGDKKIDWWFSLLLTGGALQTKVDQQVADIYAEVGISDSNLLQNIHRWNEGWGHSSTSRFAEIFEKIEQLSKWN